MRRVGISLTLIALTLIASDNALSEESAGAPDRLCGWYKLTTDNRLIPVFKIEETYYTVMSRGGFEVPLKECSDGLEWPPTLPFSMVGTRIGFDEESKEIYISIVDQNREYQDPSFTSGKRQAMKAIRMKQLSVADGGFGFRRFMLCLRRFELILGWAALLVLVVSVSCLPVMIIVGPASNLYPVSPLETLSSRDPGGKAFVRNPELADELEILRASGVFGCRERTSR